MSTDLHRQAELLMEQADADKAQGRLDDAHRKYVRAAELEADVFDQLPLDRPRTRGILAVSAVSLYKHAAITTGDLDALRMVERLAHRYLGDADLPVFAHDQLQELLDESRREQQARSMGRSLVSGFSLLLRGSQISYGVAPLDLLLFKLRQFENYVLRMGEFVSGHDFREQGSTPDDVIQRCRPLVTAPSFGSFHVNLLFDAPWQPPLIPENSVWTAEQVVTKSYNLLERVAHDDVRGIEDDVPNERYRIHLLRQIRALLPDGKQIHSMELSRIGVRDPQSAVLRRATSETIQRLLPAVESDEGELAYEVGVLRGLELDGNWIKLRQGTGVLRCKVGREKPLDDEIGPYVNRMVRVVGRRKLSKNGPTFVMLDIELFTEDESTDTSERRSAV